MACNTVFGIDDPHERTDITERSDAAGNSGDSLGADASSWLANGRDPQADARVGDDQGSAAALFPHAWAEWIMPNPPSSGLPNPHDYDIKSVRAVVLDRVTNLAWQRSVDANSYDYDGAASYCAALSLAGAGWRLPTRIELLSVVDYTLNDPSIDASAFPDTPADQYWTASSMANANTLGWTISFAFGDGIPLTSARTSPHRVRCVR